MPTTREHIYEVRFGYKSPSTKMGHVQVVGANDKSEAIAKAKRQILKYHMSVKTMVDAPNLEFTSVKMIDSHFLAGKKRERKNK